ncbi:MAG: MlaE family lipid ABC transporter permease subunit [Deltaproteobacteria bacterium]|jgi:phospholipid/cholesterol/gamma-HCH transport system permease protein|nr:MlaE family lipid ABC transporter permease subunit [Deltaproteobacteria bacterium]
MIVRAIEQLGAGALYHVRDLGRMARFLGYSGAGFFKRPFRFAEVIRQLRLIGVNSTPLILFIGLFTGMVLGLQGYHTLSKVGMEGTLGMLVSLSLIRELGPVLTALMVTGRAGSAMCAELGIMRNSEQFDALECMAIDPFRYLISPKYLAILIAMPILTILFDLIGIFGGYLTGVVLLGINPGAYMSGIEVKVLNEDITLGLYKSVSFGLLVVWICTGRGYFVQQIKGAGFGAEGVSRVTTQAVVYTSIAVLLWNYLITAVFI